MDWLNEEFGHILSPSIHGNMNYSFIFSSLQRQHYIDNINLCYRTSTSLI